jgi:hypothetical protein
LLKYIALLTALALPATTFAEELWSDDFESGDFSAWTKQDAVPGGLQIVSNPVRHGSGALKVTVNQYDDAINTGNDRAELVNAKPLETEGTEFFYGWSVMFAPDFPSANTWQLFTQWHHDGLNGSPPLEMYVVGEEIRLRTGGTEPAVWKAPLQRGKWQDFILHVKWSSDPDKGFVELYQNGEVVLERTAMATMLPGMRNYLKMGLYRNRSVTERGVVYFDDWVKATTLEELPQKATKQASSPQSLSDSDGTTSSGTKSNGTTSSLTYDPENQLGETGGGCAAGGNTVPAALAIGFALFATIRRRTQPQSG